MNAYDVVRIRHVGKDVVFELVGEAFRFRNAFVSMTSDGIFIKFDIADNQHVRHVLSSGTIISRDDLYHTMVSIRDMYNLREDNEEDAERIIEALCTIERKETALNNSDQIYRLIEAADRCRKEIVLCLLGKPGIGKTEAVERFARDHGRDVVHIIASQILPSEVSGMTMPNQETKSMDIFDHYRLSHMKDGDILFFDELLKGQQQVLNACLTLIQERRLMSGTKLPDVLVIAAANPLATPAQLPVEIRQRFLFVDVEWDEHGWINYMKALGFKDYNELAKLAIKVKASLDQTDRWNTLTPRTATKLCLWLKASGNSVDVREYILSTFGADVLSRISGAVNGLDVEKPEVQFAKKIIDFIDKHGNEEDPEDNLNSAHDRSDALALADAIVNGEMADLSELLDTLMKLPEWEQIQEVLKATEIERESIEF